MLGVLGLTWTDGFRPVVIAYLRLLNTRLLGVRAYRNHIPRALWKPYIELLFGRILSEPSLTTASSTEAAQTIGLLFISSANALGTEASVIWRFFHAVYVDRQALEAPLHHVLMPALGHFLLDWCSRTRLTDHVADMVAISTACMAHWSSRNESYRNGIVFFQRAVLEVLATDVAGGGQLDAASFDMVDDIWRMCAIRKALDGHLQMSAQLFVEAGAESLESWRPVVGGMPLSMVCPREWYSQRHTIFSPKPIVSQH